MDGNASDTNDVAAAVLVMKAEKAKELDLKSLVRIRIFAAGELDPAYMGLGPVAAVRKVLEATGMGISDIDMIELNEAFATQAIGCMQELVSSSTRPNNSAAAAPSAIPSDAKAPVRL